MLDLSSMVPLSEYQRRLSSVRSQMHGHGVDTLLLSIGHDMPYLIGYHAMPLERLTMLVVPAEGDLTLIVPALEEPRVHRIPELFDVVPWNETEDPLDLVANECSGASTIAVGDQMWSRFLVGLLSRLPHVSWTRANEVVSPARMVKGAAEIAALKSAAAAVDRIAARLQAGDIALVGRTEAEVSAELSRQILAEGHQKVNFAIVAAGENAASPHHHPGDRIIGRDEIVLCDFGGTMNGYCSDITRCVVTGAISSDLAAAWSVLQAAQDVGVRAGVVGVACEEVDRATRAVIAEAGYGEYFVHRTGHGIGLEEHEDPYMVEGSTVPLAAGHAYSVEPGIYVPGKWGMRLEDIVVATDEGPLRLNEACHDLVSVSA